MERTKKEILLEALESAKTGVPFDLTFAPTSNLNDEECKLLQNYLQSAFNNWSETWIISRLEILLEKMHYK